MKKIKQHVTTAAILLTGALPASASQWTLADFQNSIGVNAHLTGAGCGTAYCDVGTIAAELRYIGVDWIRTSLDTGAGTMTTYRALSAAMPSLSFQFVHKVQADMAGESAVAHSVAEGPNEINSGSWGGYPYGDISCAAALRLQRDMYANAKAAGVPVVSFSMSVGRPTPYCSDASAWTDDGNVHDYVGKGLQPDVQHAFNYSHQAAANAPGKPYIITENGAFSAMPAADPLPGGAAVTERVQGLLDLNMVLLTHQFGASGTILYQLVDTVPGKTSACGCDYSQDYYGLFALGGRAKPAAVYLHNLSLILADRDKPIVNPAPLAVTITGLLPHEYAECYARSDGAYACVIADARPIWNAAALKQTANAPHVVRMTFPAAVNVDIYDPTVGPGYVADPRLTTGVTEVDVSVKGNGAPVIALVSRS